MLEHNLLVTLLWVLFVSVVILGFQDFYSHWVMRRTNDQTRLGNVLRRNFLALSIRHFMMTAFHFVFAYVVTFGHYPVGSGWRAALYALAAIASLVAMYYGLQRGRILHEEHIRSDQD